MGVEMTGAPIPAGQGVFVFNTSPHIIYLNVNNAEPKDIRTIPAASAFNWLPTPSRPRFALNATAQPNSFGLGDNLLSITPDTSGQTLNQTVHVASSVKMTDTLQLYIATGTVNSIEWWLQVNGKPVAGYINLPTQ